MSEINSNNEEVTDGASKSSSPPVISSITETNSIIERADKIATRIEEANKKAEELVNRQEAIAARIMLSGKAEAGQVSKTPQQSQEEQADEMARNIIKRFRR